MHWLGILGFSCLMGTKFLLGMMKNLGVEIDCGNSYTILLMYCNWIMHLQMVKMMTITYIFPQ